MDFNQFFEIYKDITSECIFSNDPTETFYYNEQDKLNNNLLVQKCIEIDISGAFPALCKYLFGADHPFVKKIFEFDNKFERNKFISIQMTHNTNLTENGLKLLNSYCKIIILGYIYNNFANVTIIQYAKDGAIFTGTLNYNKNDKFNNYIQNNMDIHFHIDLISNYLRFNKTSICNYLNKPIEIKGRYKESPKYLQEIILVSIFNGEFFENQELQNEIKKIYTELYYMILYNGALHNDINYYYKFQNKWIQQDGSLNIIPANPKFILYNFLYPIITLIKGS